MEPSAEHAAAQWVRDRLRYGYSKATLEEIAYLTWRAGKGDAEAGARLAVLLAELERPSAPAPAAARTTPAP